MLRSLIKKRSTTDFLFVAVLFHSFSAQAFKAQHQWNFDVRYGMHTQGDPTIATHRHTAELEQKFEFNSEWSTVLGARAESELAYAATPERYESSGIAKTDATTFLPRDNYLQYSKGSIRTRLGYQQVVWGEAFGAYYADIVNPKDLREGGLGDLSRNRLASPMLNVQWIGESSSLQALYLPIPMMNLLPSYGSDFNPIRLPADLANVPLTIEKNPSEKPSAGEFGFRATKQVSSYDMSLFYLNYMDRMPVYRLDVTPVPLSLKAIPEMKPLQTVGATVTKDFDGFLVRAEALEHLKREMNIIQDSGLSTAKSDELVYVLGLDLPPYDKWQINFQFSQSILSAENWAFRAAKQDLVTARLGKTLSHEIFIEALASYYTMDGSQLLQAKAVIPIADQLEMALGIDSFDGSESSELGRFKNASRSWILFKAFVR